MSATVSTKPVGPQPKQSGARRRRARIIAISGTTPEPPATSSTDAGWVAGQTNQPPIGPRSSI